MEVPGMTLLSEVEICGRSSTSRCGYCRSSGQLQGKSHVTFGMTSKRLSCKDYQALLDRGWRRSGTYLYKPLNSETCCPCYTIRLEAQCFRPSKSQRHVSNKLQRFVTGVAASGASSTGGQQPQQPQRSSSSSSLQHRASELDATGDALRSALQQAVRVVAADGVLDLKGFKEEAVRVQRAGAGAKGKSTPPSSSSRAAPAAAVVVGDYSTALALQLSAHIRKCGNKAVSPQEVASLLVSRVVLPAPTATASVAANGFINFHLGQGAAAMEAASEPSTAAAMAVPLKEAAEAEPGKEEGKARAWAERSQQQQQLRGGKAGRRQQGEEEAAAMEVLTDLGGAMEGKGEDDEDEDDDMQVDDAQQQHGGGSSSQPHSFTVETVPARVTDEVFELYRKYQVAVHGDSPDEVTKQGFKRFLVSSPLVLVSSSGVASTGGAQEEDPDRDCKVPYGSYHQLYRVDGQLVAVGVVDILPSCLSSVYCFYDPDFRSLSLGKVTALREIDWVQRASRYRPELKYYYLGFYIHSCPKMKYKGDYEPSELLCPETYQWVPLAPCRPVLDRTPYARLAQVLEGLDSAAAVKQDKQQQQPKPALPGPGGALQSSMASSASSHGPSSATAATGGAVTTTAAPASQPSQQQRHESDDDSDDDELDEDDDEEEEEEEDQQLGAQGMSTEREEERRAMARGVRTDIGPLEALPDRFQRMLTPILADFAEHVGPQLATRLFVSFR